MMTQEEFEQRLIKIKEQEKRLGVKINFDASHCIDKDHLDCLWYGGEVGTIECSNGYIITIGAYGDIRVDGHIDGESFDFKDKGNSGRAYGEFGHKVNDDRLYELIDNPTDDDGLFFEDNNWFEVDLIKDGQWIDLCGADNVLSNNILDCFEGIEKCFEYIKWVEED